MVRRIFFPAVCLLIVILYLTESSAYDRMQRLLEDGQTVRAAGTVTAREVRDTSVLYQLRSVVFYLHGHRYHVRSILLYSEEEEIPLGSRVISSGMLSAFSEASNQGSFDARSYYRSQQIQAQQRSNEIRMIRNPVFPWRECLQKIREKVRSVFARELPARDAGILSAMTLGDKSLMETEVRQQYQNMGISHILAISGLHISLIGMSLYRLFRKRLQLSYGFSCICSGVLVLSFGIMSGFSVSTQRAVIMFAFYLGAEYWGRSYTFLTSMLFSAVIVLCINPLAVTQAGFLLSYCAVFSIFSVHPVIEQLFPSFSGKERKRDPEQNEDSRIPDFLRKQLASYYSGFQLSLSIWFAMLPITAWFFFQVPLLSVLLNTFVLPLCGPLLGLSLIGGLTGCMHLPFFSEILSPGILRLSHLILTVFDFQMNSIGSLKGSSHITGQPELVVVWLFYLFLYGGVLFYQNSGRISRYLHYLRYCSFPAITESLLAGLQRGISWLDRRKKTCRYRCMAATFLLPVLLSIFILSGNERHSFSVSMLDVGQGDGICVSSSDGTHVFVDGGSTSTDHAGTYRILPFLKYRCIRKIDYWLISHTDEDHVNGILEVLESGYPVGCLVFSKHAPSDSNKEKLLQAAAENHTKVLTVKAGDRITCRDFAMQCLYPDQTDISEDTNAMSQIWILRAEGLSMLFTGDLGSNEEKTLISRGLLEKIDVLKVGHHGSKNSSCEEFLEILKPDNALISVGKHNTYGHPSPETLERLSDCGAKSFATMDYGQLEVILKNGSYEIRAPMKEHQ